MNPPDGSPWLYLLLLVILIAINAFFAMSELAVISLNDAKLKHQAEEGNKKAKTLLKLTGEPSRFLSTIQVGVTLSGLLASAVAADTFAEYIVYACRELPVSPKVVEMVSLVVITLILSFFTLVFGELVPKRIAMQHYEKISFRIVKPLLFIYRLEKPFVLLLSWSTNLVLRLIGINPNEKPEEVTEEEIRMMVDAGNENGSIEQSEKEMINNIFEFDDRTAVEIMTHRTEVTAVESNAPISEIIRTAVEEGYSRIPVYEDDLDNIVGILYVKDLLSLVLKDPSAEFKISSYMRPPLFVPETNRCKELFQEFKAKKVQMAVVVDEYGGTSGLVTMEDLLESIVGNIQDEYDDEEEEISRLSEHLYLLSGITGLEDVEDLFHITFPEDREYDTIGGFIIDSLGRMPKPGEQPIVTFGNVTFTALGMKDRRISRVRAEQIPQKEAPETEEAD